jgi:lipopolysaccharide/colanic/teichoic acid biosynthesis glycosyltransferase
MAAVGNGRFHKMEEACWEKRIMNEHELDAALIRRYEDIFSHPRRLELKTRIQRFLGGLLRSAAHQWKRDFDILGSLGLILLSLPVLMLIAVLIKLEDRGPVLFRQTRVGKNGRLFKMLKFRSMCRDAEQRMDELLERNEHKKGVTFKIKEDPRVTRIGKYLRKYSLDELPQFFNVLSGDMSLVGPRPPVPREVALYSLEDRRRLLITPGITCFWQVGGRSEIDFHGQVKLDLDYIEQQSFRTDLRILLRTIPAVLWSKGAY